METTTNNNKQAEQGVVDVIVCRFILLLSTTLTVGDPSIQQKGKQKAEQAWRLNSHSPKFHAKLSTGSFLRESFTPCGTRFFIRNHPDI
jgi:hypothetical protein